jgi:DEAD/DEAH box helicase domain-containing protein
MLPSAAMRSFVESLVGDGKLSRHVVYRGVAEGRPARTVGDAGDWPPGSREGMHALGVESLYSHQAAALDASSRRENVLLATPTASGKTLSYLLALLASRQSDPCARALFVYPLKALARDQLTAIRTFLSGAGLAAEAVAEVYDGDTPESARRRIRRQPPLAVLTNPDMLHLGILPHHDTWAPFLGSLALVVLDEAHVYRGIFGAHVRHVLRRLLRLARAHGADPRIVAGSATIGAPREFIETLTGEPFGVVRESGAPQALRHVVFLAPDAVSPYTVATRALARSVEAGHKTIAFTKARRITELMHRWLRDSSPEIASRVASYRAGYLPEERREIESRLFSGQLDGVISTSALESGIDVGGLDVCVLVGYPGSLANSWQRIGRAGRGSRESLAVLVALPDALDRYVVRHPEHFFSGDFERVVLDPENDTVADLHLQAAAAERSLDPSDVEFLAGPGGERRLARLVEQGRVSEVHGERRWFSLRRRPQREIGLRNAGRPYSLILAGSSRSLGSLDQQRVWFEGHPGAIYLHAGQSYRVLDVSADERVIRLERAEVDYYTQVYARKETEILERFEQRPLGPATLAWGRLRVTTFIEGYGRKRLFSQEEISRHPLEAPPQVLETVGFWIEFPVEMVAQLVADERHPVGSLHALEHAAIGLFPLLAICDRWDLGGISYARHPQLNRPAVFVYDGWPGGVGLARTGYVRAEELLDRTQQLISGCECDDGCPACVHSPKCGSGNVPLDKAGASEALQVVLGRRALETAAVQADSPEVRRALESHRSVAHGGVRGGAALPEGFFQPEPARPAAVEDASAAQEGNVRLAGQSWPAGLPMPDELIRENEGRWIFFDLETLRGAEEVGGWSNIRDMGLALAVTLDAATGVLTTWREQDAPRLVDELLSADTVVGFNHERFDLEVLSAYEGSRVRRVRSLDLLQRIRERIGFRIGLGHLASETLGSRKSADGLQSLEWVREGRWDLIEKYCRADVVLTAALWAYGRDRGYVLFRNREGLVGRIPAGW